MSTRPGFAARWTACLLVVGASVPARADQSTEARVFFEQGNRTLEEAMSAAGPRRTRLLERALESYVQSLRIVRSRNVLFNAGIVSSELGENEGAFGYFRDYLVMPGLSEADHVEATRRIDALRPSIAVLAVTSTPEGAEIWVDRQDLGVRGRTPLEIAVLPGPHTVMLALTGYARAEVSAEAVLGQTTPAEAELAALPVPVRIVAPAGGRLFVDGSQTNPVGLTLLPGTYALRYERGGQSSEREIVVPAGAENLSVELLPTLPALGMLRLRSSVDVEFSIDGVRAGRGTIFEHELAAGLHRVRIEASGYAPIDESVNVSPTGGDFLLDMNRDEPGPRRLGAWPWVAGVTAGTVGAAALGLSLRARDLNDRFEDIAGRAPVDDQERAADRVDRANTLADAFWVATVAMTVTTVVLALVNKRSAPAPSRLRPMNAAELREAP